MAIPAELLTGGSLCRLQIAYFTMKMHLIFKQSSQAKKLQNSLVYQLGKSFSCVRVRCSIFVLKDEKAKNR